GALVRGVVRTEGEPFPGAARRPAGQAARAPETYVSRAAQPPAPPRFEPLEDPPLLEAKPEREAPPPPVVPALAKGARAKKKKKE
ncbi:MAG TPA: hypothetical protein VFZ53_04775, partial [Polyangiaceae bacterium]